jgi:hypothetical protein
MSSYLAFPHILLSSETFKWHLDRPREIPDVDIAHFYVGILVMTWNPAVELRYRRADERVLRASESPWAPSNPSPRGVDC